jgi:hypothetical protein
MGGDPTPVTKLSSRSHVEVGSAAEEILKRRFDEFEARARQPDKDNSFARKRERSLRPVQTSILVDGGPIKRDGEETIE